MTFTKARTNLWACLLKISMWGPRLVLLLVVLVPSAWGRVLLHWTKLTVPPAQAVGITQLVITWNSNSSAFVKTARQQGYSVYVEASPEQIPQIAAVSQKLVAAIIVEITPPQMPQADGILKRLQASYPSLTFLLLDPNGKQPQMKGTMVVKREGVLEITSPTAQPWLDSNAPLVRFEQGFRPAQIPLYTFAWDRSDPLQQKQGPTAEDYSLAIAEAGALHADLILNIPEELQTALVDKETSAWALWKDIIPCLEFASSSRDSQPEANIGVVTDDYESAYEPMNLMARHNIPFRVLPATSLNTNRLRGLKIVLLFTAPPAQAAREVTDFASSGGTVVAVGLAGPYPWQTAPATRAAEHAMSYSIGKGKVFELSEPVSDPETFAQDVRRLIKEQDVLLSLWNALTTIGFPYRNPKTRTTVLELVNYSGEPLRLQGRVKGSFASIRLQSPRNGCCQSVHPVQRDGFTEFVIPELRTTVRVSLRWRPNSP
jgi:hypothetical protein